MSEDQKSIRTPLAKARGLGSAKGGAGEWINLRMTAAALIPLSVYVVIGFVNNAVNGGYSGAIYWLQSPVSATLMILMVLAGLYHGVGGLKEVIEDYFHCPALKFSLIFGTKLMAAALAILGVLSVAKIFFGV